MKDPARSSLPGRQSLRRTLSKVDGAKSEKWASKKMKEWDTMVEDWNEYGQRKLDEVNEFVENFDGKEFAERSQRYLMDEGNQTVILSWVGFTLGLLFVYFFALYLPPLTAFFSGKKLYTRANFEYDPITKFDESFFTWGTDYLLAVVMFAFCSQYIVFKDRDPKLAAAAILLIGSYGVSTFAGALCHHFLGQKLNTAIFRFFWRICVGAVGAAGGFMGLCASQVQRNVLETETPVHFKLGVVPDLMWYTYAAFFTGVVCFGFYSMKQPACDIFLTGVTQTPPTIYFTLVVIAQKRVTAPEILLVIGLLLNIILLPLYDVLNFIDLKVGYINLILHTNLLFAWSFQAIGLVYYLKNQ